MNLGELLDELRNNILHDRSDQVAGASDRLWSDDTLVRYINEAQTKMAREGLLIRDAVTPEVVSITTVAGQKDYPLHPSVIAVLSARCLASTPLGLPDDTADLARAGHSALTTYHMPETYFFDPSSLSALQPGKIVAYDTDEGIQQDAEGSWSGMSLRVYPAPSAAFTQPITLRVLRVPLNPLEKMSDVPEIPVAHHLDMLDWAAHLALRIVDRDMGDIERAAAFEASFDKKTLKAKNQMMRKLFTPAPWGFGRNGFSYES